MKLVTFFSFFLFASGCILAPSISLALTQNQLENCRYEFRRDLGAKLTYSLVQAAHTGRYSQETLERAQYIANTDIENARTISKPAISRVAKLASSCPEFTDGVASILADAILAEALQSIPSN